MISTWPRNMSTVTAIGCDVSNLGMALPLYVVS
jgi:hypothetical protein